MFPDIDCVTCQLSIDDGILVDICYDLCGIDAALLTIAIWCGVPRL